MQKMIARIPHPVKSLNSTLSLVKWPQCASSIILDCLIPKFTVTLFLRSVVSFINQHCEDGVDVYGIHKSYESQ